MTDRDVLRLTTILIWLALTAAVLLVPGCRPSTGPYTYPRLTAASWRIIDTDPRDMIRYNIIMGTGTVDGILAWRQRAREQGLGDWESRAMLIQVLTPYTAPLVQPASYRYQSQVEDPMNAIWVAAWENRQLGADWYLPDAAGQPIPVWHGNPQGYQLNVGPDCPLGKYGDTQGLTFIEWLSGPWLERFKGRWHQAWDGCQIEDMPDVINCYLAGFRRGVIPGPGLPAMTCEQFRERARPHFSKVYAAYKSLLLDGVLVRCNGHFSLDECPTRYQLSGPVHKTFAACKIECIGDWGGCPGEDAPKWLKAYQEVERDMHPLSETAATDGSQLDRLQGWDLSTCECRPQWAWNPARSEQWMREWLACTLMGDGTFSAEWLEDEYDYGSQYDPGPSIPEMYLPLGRALGPVREIVDPQYPSEPLYYREFQGTSLRTVCFNPWDHKIAGVPAHDGKWLEGSGFLERWKVTIK